MIVVVDASVAVKWYIEEEYTPEAETLLNGFYKLNAPELILPEFGNIIWKKVRRGQLTSTESRSIIGLFKKQEITFQGHRELLAASCLGAEMTGQTVYDWTYLALAVSLGCVFVTADNKFYNALQNLSLRKHLLWIGDL